MKHIALLAVLLCDCSPHPGEAYVDRYFDPFERDYAKTNFVLAVKGDYVQYRYWLGGRWHTNSTSLWMFQRIVRKVPSPIPKAEHAAVRSELEELSNTAAFNAVEFAKMTNTFFADYSNVVLTGTAVNNSMLSIAYQGDQWAELRYLNGDINNSAPTNLLFKTKYHPVLTGCDENGWWVVRFEENKQ